MEAITNYFASFGLDLNNTLVATGVILLGTLLLVIIGRFIFSFISGMAFFGSSAAGYGMTVPVYSFCYNGAYIFTEAAITFVVLALPPVKNACMRIKALAISEGN